MINPDIRLVASDMDGTLLDSSHHLNESFFHLFEKLHDNGILFAAASGRQFFNLQKIFRSIEDKIIFVAENGSYVVYKGEELIVQDLEKTVVHQFIDICRGIPGAHAVLCGKKKAYIENASPAFLDHVTMYFERYEIVTDLKEVSDDQFLKFTICDLIGSEQNSYPQFKRFQNDYQVKVSGNIWLDLSHRLANKGRALSFLQEKFSISMEQTMVFGDYLNDLEMMHQAYFSYAMGNAHPDIKDAARFLTGDNNENGVIKVLEKMTAVLHHKMELPGNN